jgi:hypothetical protein
MNVLLVSNKYPPEYSGSGNRAHATSLRLHERFGNNAETICSSVEITESENYEVDGIPTNRVISKNLRKIYHSLGKGQFRRLTKAAVYHAEARSVRKLLKYSTPVEIRNGTQLLSETLKHLNPKLLKVRNANTNLRPDLSPMKLTINSCNRELKRCAGMRTSKLSDLTVADRSWPSESEMLRNSPMLMSRIEHLSDSTSIASLGIFENTKIDSIASEFSECRTAGSSALLALLTIDEFISHN